MAAPAAVPGLTSPVSSAAEDATYKSTMAQIEHGEGLLIGNAYGTTGEIAGELGQAIANTNTRVGEQVGPNYAKTGELGGSLGLRQGITTRAQSARAGANTQSGLYGTERANTLLGFTQRAQGVERGGKEAIERIDDRARKAWEAAQEKRSTAAIGANNRYLNYVLKNPMPGTPATPGTPSNPRAAANIGPSGQRIVPSGNMGGPTPVGGFGTPGNLGVIQAGGVRAGRPTFLRPPPKPRGRR